MKLWMEAGSVGNRIFPENLVTKTHVKQFLVLGYCSSQH